MKLLYLIHIYQPSYQSKEILKKVVDECYSKMFHIINRLKKGKIILNINASLTELLYENGYQNVLDQIKRAAKNGKIEFTGSGAFHPILPLIPEIEQIRQIELNNEINRRFIGESYNPIGFFCPEMCFSPKISKVIYNMGFKWAILDETAFNGKIGSYPKDSVFKNQNLKILFRNRNISNALAYSIWRKEDIDDIEQLKKMVSSQIKKGVATLKQPVFQFFV